MPSYQRFIALLAACAVTQGCGAEIWYGARPLGRPPTSDSEACYQRRSLEVTTGTAEVAWTESAGYGYERHISEYNRGLVFYRDGQRLTPTRTLAILGDRELSGVYAEKLEAHEARYDRSRNALVFGTVGFLGSTAGMLAYSSIDTDGAGTDRHKQVIGGLALTALISIPFMLFGSFTVRKRKQKWDAYRELLSEQSIVDRVQYRIDEHNRGVAAECAR